jgi:hypothetical protein
MEIPSFGGYFLVKLDKKNIKITSRMSNQAQNPNDKFLDFEIRI